MSQFNEDKVLQILVNEVGEGSRVICDVGAGKIDLSNAKHWIEKGWKAVLIEANQPNALDLAQEWPDAVVINTYATIENINDLVPKDTQILSIDIDSDDWWVWANLIVRPALVVVETVPGNDVFVPAYKAQRKKHYGMTLGAAVMLGNAKGYDFIGRNEVNAIFCRKDLKAQYRMPSPPTHGGIPSCRDRNIF